MPHIVVYDMEILRPIPERNGKPDWDYARAGKCGIASAVLYDSETRRYHIYDKHMVEELLEHLNSAELLVGFNNIGFDKPAIEGASGIKIKTPQLDLLAEIKKNCSIKGQGVWGLGPICERTLGVGKSGDGASAPHLAAVGQWGKLLDYNLNDTYLTLALFNHIVSSGWITSPDGAKKYLATAGWPKDPV